MPYSDPVSVIADDPKLWKPISRRGTIFTRIEPDQVHKPDSVQAASATTLSDTKEAETGLTGIEMMPRAMQSRSTLRSAGAMEPTSD